MQMGLAAAGKVERSRPAPEERLLTGLRRIVKDLERVLLFDPRED